MFYENVETKPAFWFYCENCGTKNYYDLTSDPVTDRVYKEAVKTRKGLKLSMAYPESIQCTACKSIFKNA